MMVLKSNCDHATRSAQP